MKSAIISWAGSFYFYLEYVEMFYPFAPASLYFLTLIYAAFSWTWTKSNWLPNYSDTDIYENCRNISLNEILR